MRTNDESIKLLENSKPIKRLMETDRQTQAERRTVGRLTDREACIQRDKLLDSSPTDMQAGTDYILE